MVGALNESLMSFQRSPVFGFFPGIPGIPRGFCAASTRNSAPVFWTLGSDPLGRRAALGMEFTDIFLGGNGNGKAKR